MKWKTPLIISTLVLLVFVAGCDDDITEQCAELDPVGQSCEENTECAPVLCECLEDNWQGNPRCIDGACEGVEAACAGIGRSDRGACADEGGWTGDCS